MHFDERHQETASVENTPNAYKPWIGPGCRIPHLKFADGKSINDLISFDGYTLLIVDAAVIVTDSTSASSYARSAGPVTMSAAVNKPLVKELIMYFNERHIPLKLEDIAPMLNSVESGPQSEIIDLYRRQSVILVRPDLYVLWNLNLNVNQLSTLDIKHIAETACCEVNKDDIIAEWKSTSDFLTKRFITNIQGYRSLHTQAIYFEDADKNAVMRAIAMKAKVETVNLTSKIVNSAENQAPQVETKIRSDEHAAVKLSSHCETEADAVDSAAITLRMSPATDDGSGAVVVTEGPK